MVKEVIMKLMVVMEMVLDKEIDVEIYQEVDNEVTKSVNKKVVEKLDDVYFFMKWIKPTFSKGLVLEMILHLKSFVSIKVFSFSTLKFCRLSLLYLFKFFSTVPF